MKNKQLKANWLFLICLIAMPMMANANSIEETIITEKTYKVNSDSKLEIYNKYGDLHIHAWENDSVKIMVTQKFSAADRTQLDKLKRAISLTITKTKYIVMVKSRYDDTNKGILSILPLTYTTTNDTKVDVEIWMPSSLHLSIKHRYGDVFLDEISGDANIEVSHGQFNAQYFSRNLILSTNYCNSSIGYVHNANIVSRFSDLTVDSAKKVVLESRSADVIIGHCGSLNIDGRNDDILVGSCDNLKLAGYFSKARFEIVYGNVSSKTSYGNLKLAFPKGYDSNIEIQSNYTDIELAFKENSGYYPVEILHQKSRLMYPASNTSLKEEKVSGKDVIYKTMGTLGSGNLLDGELNVEMFSGELKLIIQ